MKAVLLLFLLMMVSEYSLKHSSHNQLKRLVKEEDTNVEAAVVLVMKNKEILPEVHAQ